MMPSKPELEIRFWWRFIAIRIPIIGLRIGEDFAPQHQYKCDLHSLTLNI
jgi:hypothetical protein